MPTPITNTHLLELFVQNLQRIVVSAVIFAVAAFGVSYMMPKKYTASGLVYANHSNNLKDVALNPAIGAEYQADKLIQLFKSQAMEQRLVREFDLIGYYGLDTSQLNWRQALHQRIQKDFNATRNAFLTVEVTAKATDAEMAANVVNSMITSVDTIRQDILNENLKNYVAHLSEKVDQKEGEVLDKLQAIFEYTAPQSTQNVLSQHKQKAISERQRVASFVQGDAVVAEALANNYSVELERMVDQYYLELGRFNTLKADLHQANQKLQMPFPGVYKIRMAEANYQPSSPKTLLMVLIGAVAGAVCMFLAILIKDRVAQMPGQKA
jgi:LPS O-antigen subunit length determinant protein (WzzB/FepE family)